MVQTQKMEFNLKKIVAFEHCEKIETCALNMLRSILNSIWDQYPDLEYIFISYLKRSFAMNRYIFFKNPNEDLSDIFIDVDPPKRHSRPTKIKDEISVFVGSFSSKVNNQKKQHSNLNIFKKEAEILRALGISKKDYKSILPIEKKLTFSYLKNGIKGVLTFQKNHLNEIEERHCTSCNIS